ncbi:glycosyltransferase [Rosenbergiella epipactidis]|uniref:glycosyltransferase n=1 Tax=Rosenbergiella epipactidis TaxID=1544694 RepID=UPI0031450724
MSEIKFSVLMSLYNKELSKNLFQCLDSLNRQTLKADEVIIVYDGLIDYELDSQVLAFKDILNIKIVKLSENQGLGNALNHGLKYVSHNIVARMDTDDICLAERFEKQLQVIQKFPDIDILGSSVIEFDDENNTSRTKNLPIDNLSIVKYALFKNPINHMSVVFKKDKVEKIGGYKHHLFMEDYNLWLRGIKAGLVFANTDENLLHVRVNSEMVKRRKGSKYIRSEFQLLKIKLSLKIYPIHKVLISFIIRTSTRFLPNFLLKKIYSMDRK